MTTTNDTGASVLPVSAEEAAFVSLMAGVKARCALQPKVRILRGGYKGDCGRLSGPGEGKAGGDRITTDSHVDLYLSKADYELVGA